MEMRDIVRSVRIFGDLTEQQSAELLKHAYRQTLQAGSTLVRKGEPSDDIFIVLCGRFAVYVDTQPDPVAEISVGEVIGEIGFFARHKRTATVVAVRDSEVIKLDRAGFDTVTKQIPQIYEIILASLASRLADTTAQISGSSQQKTPRTIALIWGGRSGYVRPFVDRLRSVFSRRGRTLILEA